MVESTDIGVVIIGRNEGERLVRCLTSASGIDLRVVYVDSGSTDDSRNAAIAAGAQVVDLDLSKPFTAARARNAGYKALTDQGPLAYVQFIDGDCEFQSGWLDFARTFLQNNPEVAVVCGRRRERFPEASVYNRLCDWEWDTPIGQAKACGGDAMMRRDAFDAVGGFNENLIAGEEPELCVRLRQSGWKIWRLDHEMTWHDAAVTRFGQWWKRSRRAGHAYAEGASLHGAPPEKHRTKEVKRALVWSALLPVALVTGAFISCWAFLILLLYPFQIIRLATRDKSNAKDALERAFFTTIGKFPEATGILEFHFNKMTRSQAKIIEYK